MCAARTVPFDVRTDIGEQHSLQNEKDLSFVEVGAENLHELRAINAALFPMTYPASYYRSVLETGSIARLVYWRGTLAATLSCRLQSPQGAAGVSSLLPRASEPHCAAAKSANGGCTPLECYIMTLGVLAPYRRLGIGSAMLAHICAHYAAADPRPAALVLHVHTANNAALRFYHAHGFSIAMTLPEYYFRLSPQSAYLLSAPIN